MDCEREERARVYTYYLCGTYLALLQPQIIIELQRAAQFLRQILWLDKFG